MRFKVLLPAEVLVDREVSKITAEAEDGSFCLLPHHVDFVAALVPGLLSYFSEDGEESFVAVDEGVLVKCGPEVLVSTQNAATGPDLGELQQAVAERLRATDERERETRTALARLEVEFVRRFMEI